MKIFENIFYIMTIVFLWGCEKEEPIVPEIKNYKDLNTDYWGIDTTNNIIVYNGKSISMVDNELAIGNTLLKIESDDTTITIGKSYAAKFLEKAYKLYYTQLPIISITTNNSKILDDPKICGRVKILEKDKSTFNSFIGIELRGGESQHYPKQSFSLELWKNKKGDTKLKTSLLEMRIDDDWILDGMWNEPNRIRDFTSHDLWLDIGRIQKVNKKTKIGINRKYCELFLNGKYNGVYYLSEKIDKKQLDLKEYSDQIEGELYKGYSWKAGVTYKGIIDYNNKLTTWNGYEAKYPEDIGFVDWTNLYNHIKFVTNSNQADFNSEISKRIDIDNAIDYYIFLNLIYAIDNTGKNIYTCKLDKSALYFFVAWDMDGSFGNDWSGERTDITNKILSNGLYDRLLAYPDFKNGLKERWTELRGNILRNDNLKNRFIENNDYLVRNAIHMREAQIPDIAQNYSSTEILFIESWIDRRIAFLDDYFNSL